MALYVMTATPSSGVQGTPAADIRAPANTSARVVEIGYFNSSAGSPSQGIGRSPNIVTQTGQVNVIPEDPTETTPGQCTVAITWSAPPLIPLQFFRRPVAPPNVGGGYIFTFRQGLGLPPGGSSIVLWNIIGSTLPYLWFLVDE